MFVLLGSNGQITSQLARLLLAEGHPVRVVGRNAGALAALEAAGAQVAAGDPADGKFLARAFTGAKAVYTMTPPCYGEPDMRAAQDRIGAAIAQALRTAGVPRVVNLSSIGAELPSGTSLAQTEREVDALAAQIRKVPGVRETFAPWEDPQARPLVRFDGVSKAFGETTAVDDVSVSSPCRSGAVAPSDTP